MISSQGQDQNAQSDQGNDILIALEKSLSLDDQSTGEASHTNGCPSLDVPGDKEHLKVRIHLHDDKAFDFSPGVTAHHAVHKRGRVSGDRPAIGRRLLRTLAFGVITPAMVGAAFAWQFYSDGQTRDMARGWGTSPRESSLAVSASFRPSNSDVAAQLAAKTSDRIPTQDTVLPQAASVTPSAPVSVAPESSPELQNQLETMLADIAVVRRVVERLAAVQEQMALDIVTLQKSRKVSLPPQPSSAPTRKYMPSITHSEAVVHSSSVPVPTALARTPAASP